jgi:RHS repeat-associated protein
VLEVRRNGVSFPHEQFVWHPNYIDALAARFYDANTNNSVVEHYYCHDANFNVTAVVNTSGTVLERYAYTPYGELTVMNASFSPISASTIGNSYTFTGREFDAETGLYHFRNRYYHAQLGRSVSRDPIGYEGSQWNLYEYVKSRPVDTVDPTGNAGDPDPIGGLIQIVDWVDDGVKRVDDWFYGSTGWPLMHPRRSDGSIMDGSRPDDIRQGVIPFGPSGGIRPGGLRRVHGNSLDSPRTATLYRQDEESNLLKWGVSQDPLHRYPKYFLEDKRLVPVESGTRKDIIARERELVETQPGPLNLERWAGRRSEELP